MDLIQEQLTYIGVYGILLNRSCILLTEKLKGPYKGLLDLPGGRVEFGETLQEALSRELEEEVALQFSEMQLFDNLTHKTTYQDNETIYIFHHIGLIYSIKDFSRIPNVVPQDPFSWHLLKDLQKSSLTPFAREVVSGKKEYC